MEKLSLVFEKLSLYLGLVLLAFIPLFPKLPVINVRGTFVAIRLEDFLIALTLLIWGLSVVTRGRLTNFFKDRLNQTLTLFFFVGAVSLFSAIFVTHSVSPSLGILHYLRRIELILLLPLLVDVIKTKKHLRIALAILLVVLVLVNIYALGQQYLSWKVISTTNSEFSKGQILTLSPNGRVNSTFAGHYDLAIYLMMCLSVLTPLLFYEKLKNNLGSWANKAMISFVVGISFFVLVLTAARLSFVAAGVGIATALWLSGKRIFIVLLIIAAASALIYPSQLRDRFISTIVVNLGGGGERYTDDVGANKRNQLNLPTIEQKESTDSSEATASNKPISDIAPGEPVDTTQLGVYRSIQIRLNVEWPKALNAFYKNPLLGTGYSSLGVATDNDVLRSLGEVGILGTLAFSLIIIELIKRVWPNIKSDNRFLRLLSAGVMAMIVALLINALLIDVFEASKIASIFWMSMGIYIAAARLYKTEKN